MYNHSCYNRYIPRNLNGRFHQLVYESKIGSFTSLPKNAYNFVYVLIPGLYYKSWGDKYMQDNIAMMTQLGLDIRKLPIESSTVEDNTRSIYHYLYNEIRNNPSKKIILIGHSKGAVDAGTVIAQYNLYDYVHALISIQAPWFGTPIVNEEEYGFVKYFNIIASFVNKGDYEALRDMSYTKRNELLNRYPLNTEKIKIISLVSTIEDGSSLFYYIPNKIMRYRLNAVTDGIVRPEDGIIPGGDYIQLDDITHNETVLLFGNKNDNSKIYPGDLTYALIVLSLEKQ